MKIIEIKEDVKIPQEKHDIILEEGDKIKILKEDKTVSWKDFLSNKMLEHSSFSEFVFEIPYQKIKISGVNGLCRFEGKSLKIFVGNKANELIITPEQNDTVTIYEDFNYGVKIQFIKLGAVFYGYY